MSLVRKRKQLQEVNVDAKSKIPRDREKLLAFIDTCLERGSKRKMFSAKLLVNLKSIDRLQKLNMRFKGVLVDLKLNKVGACVAQKSCLLYDALMYKFGLQPAEACQQKNLIDYISKIIKGLESSGFKSPPSRSAVCFLGASILERIVRLDRIRMLCFKAADSSMGFVEMKHLLTFNLMCIAIASDVASESLRQIDHLSSLYDTLSEWLLKVHKRFPCSSKDLQLRSLIHRQGRKDSDKPKNLDKVRAILDLLDCKVDEVDEVNGETSADSPVNLSLPYFTS